MLMMKYLADIRQCKSENRKLPHIHALQKDSDKILESDPWNINDHDISYDEILYDKRRRSNTELSPIEVPILFNRSSSQEETEPSDSLLGEFIL